MDLFIEIYTKYFNDFDIDCFRNWDSNYARDCDTELYLGNIDLVKVIADERDPEDEWNNRIVFQYNDKFYACNYRTGSHGTGVCFYHEDLKEVFPKTKEVVYYE